MGDAATVPTGVRGPCPTTGRVRARSRDGARQLPDLEERPPVIVIPLGEAGDFPLSRRPRWVGESAMRMQCGVAQHMDQADPLAIVPGAAASDTDPLPTIRHVFASAWSSPS
jgi:hypothetical protein